MKPKHWIIGSLVGGVIVFVWQFLSWTAIGIHNNENKYLPGQDSLLLTISSVIKEDGNYMLPTTPPGASNKEMEELGEKTNGKPWAVVTYRTAYSNDMIRPLTRGLLVDIFLVFVLIYMITRGGVPTAVRILAASVAAGLFCFLLGPYTMHNWFQTPTETLHGHLIDAFVAWGITGLWLGWWLNRK